ncbi:hypothetical protein COCVIDRAFT_96271 [Bipolaris victoriae FI3]|uniref:Uncharacterized protein n=2 Tax=Bipolaris TaxID=33194 RepID=W6YN89_COCC2|nr:uncharacterized protein COCCADRAFT_97591 [Bipolaris zeicola 26-R-13]XP_014557721.1 hypothetical protein COCVIDRAFT_96271 [Bipolaris victoriae FI3]EUC32901.1 hypothetical protein COCCADRAFT_97591 [Bipolaris zeicola 26-R-13]
MTRLLNISISLAKKYFVRLKVLYTKDKLKLRAMLVSNNFESQIRNQLSNDTMLWLWLWHT